MAWSCPPVVLKAELAAQLVEVLEDGVVAFAVVPEDGWVDVNPLGDVLDDTLRYLRHVDERAARKSEQAEVDGKTQTIGGSTMTANDLDVAGRQDVEAAEVTFGQIGGDAHERVALLGSQETGCLGYHAARSMQPAAGMKAGTGMGLAKLSQCALSVAQMDHFSDVYEEA